MSQIDKAFLSAYAKKRPSPVNATEVQPLHDPTGERILKIHLVNDELLQPHGPALPARPSTSMASSERPKPASPPEQPSAPVLDVSMGRSVHISQPATRIASSSGIRREPTSSVAPPPAAARLATPQNPATPSTSGNELPTRKTLTSYLQQARQSGAAPVLPTRWSTVQPVPHSAPIQSASAPPAPVQVTPVHAAPAHSAPVPTPSSKPLSPARPPASPVQQFRIDAPHLSNPPIDRPPSTLQWSFGTVERGIKATADSQSIAARTNNEINQTATPPATNELNVSSDAVMKFDQAAKAGETRTNSHFSTGTSAGRVGPSAPPVETQRRTPPAGKSLNADSLAKISLPIQPVWEVDDFLWPNTVANLLVTQSEAFHEIGLHLQHAQSKGLRVLSITSGERGVGRSTVSMCLAKTLSKLGLKIGLVDGDYECPSLVDQLNLETQYGWQQCLLENIPLDEVAIHAVNESITLFPLTDSMAVSQVATHSMRINKLIKRISNAYDMVIIDANRINHKQSQLLGTGDEAVLDATLLIVDAELSLRQRVDAAVDLVRHQGVQSIGLVENFQS